MNLKPKTHHPTNRQFSDEYCYVGERNTPTTIQLITYNKTELNTEDVPLDTESFKTLVREDRINWFRINGLTKSDTITRLAEEFGMYSLDLRDILTPVHVVKIDNYKGRLFFILNSCYFDESNLLRTEHVAIYVRGNIVITLTESDTNLFKNIFSSLESDVMDIREQGSGYLLGFLLNTFFAIQIETASQVEDILEGIEYILLSDDNHQHKISKQIQHCRHACLIIRKNMFPLKEQFDRMVGQASNIIEEDMIPLFDDLTDQLAYVIQTIGNCREILSSLVDLYVSQNDLRANAIMKHLTVVATLFIPVTFLVGVWGMNFRLMPELHWEYGYFIAWFVLLLTIGGTWLFMKKKQWF